ncbi:MAG: class I SAM-dependent methyltransferase [Ignavibacteriales bacterium]|nr:class I SAM-dependent methyltransferase [Ignavibacteriales bacterium]
MKHQSLVNKNIIRKIIDVIFFPLRALFIPEESKFFLTSLRNERFEKVAGFCEGRVLDVGCGRGNLFIKKYIGEDRGIGIDLYEYEGVEIVLKDFIVLPFGNDTFDTLTLIAVGGHIPKCDRDAEFKEFARVLKSGGKLIMTEGEPITQFLTHKWRKFSYLLVGKTDMDSERGMKDDEEFCMPFHDIFHYLNKPPLKFSKRIKFMWGLNNIYIAQKH